ncbi:MAG: radical SAM protein [Vampirovibrionia bacterium]
MKARSLTISLPNYGCNKTCPYCVSKMTGYLKADEENILKNLRKVIDFSKRAGVLSVLFTSKGEPLLSKSFSFFLDIAEYFSDFALEIQTNGLLLNNNIIDVLSDNGMNVIAISVDTQKQLDDLKPYLKTISNKGMISRLCVNISTEIGHLTFDDLINFSKDNNVSQLTFRKLTVPEFCSNTPQAEWIKNNAPDHLYTSFVDQFNKFDKRFIRKTVDNIDIYDCCGVSIIYSDYCLQESNNSEDVRSLIYAEDGHLYTSWNSPASILF